MSEDRPLIALAGNPNTGKSTLFNALTKSRARVGNYPGITVESRIASMVAGDAGVVDVVDIPGTHSLSANSADEQLAVNALLGMRGAKSPRAVVVCVDSTRMSRGLYLALQIQEMGLPVLIALTMVDELGAPPKVRVMSKLLACPVIPVAAPRGEGIGELKEAVSELIGSPPTKPRWCWQPSSDLRAELDRVRRSFPSDWPDLDAMALWALTSIDKSDELLDIPDAVRRAVASTTMDGRAIDDEAVCGRYQWLDEHIAELGAEGRQARPWSDRVDRVLLNRFSGLAVFLLMMFVVFQSLFAWADPAIAIVEDAFAAIASGVENTLAPSLFREFITGGVIAGVGSVLVFLPQILLLFFFIGLMEASGYMARVAYLMDRVMKSMNLHGRAFVPMLSGFACAVPAILATRTLERRRDRLLTMMVVPLMTCSARLPVYTLIIAALFPAGSVLGIFPVQGLLMVLMYVFSIVIALLAALVLSRTMPALRARSLPFVIELPPYRLPRLRDVVRMMWQRSSIFLKEAGTVILVCTIGLWALLSFPRELDDSAVDYTVLIEQASSAEAAAQLEEEQQSALLRNSYGGRMGRLIEPAIAPLGFDWKIGVGIIGAFAAREVFISTMGVVYSVGEDVDEESATLRQHIRSEKRSDGRPVYTPLVGLSLMVFFALACQCMSTLAVVKRETGGYKWPGFLLLYMTVLAWVSSFLVYQGGRLLGFG